MIYEQLNISIPKGRLADLDDYARKQGQTLDGAVNKILRNALGLSEKEWNAQTEIDPRIADLPEGVQTEKVECKWPTHHRNNTMPAGWRDCIQGVENGTHKIWTEFLI